VAGDRRGAAPALWLLMSLAGCAAREPAADAEPRAEIVFTGNRELSERELRSALAEEIETAHARGLRRADINDLAFEVERLYRLRGYHFARVEDEHDPARAVIRIDEGPRVLIEEIDFQGNIALTDRQLEDLLLSERSGLFGLGRRLYVARQVAALAGAVGDAYIDRGFHEVHVGEPVTRFDEERSRAYVRLVVEEGPQYVLQAIDLREVPAADRERLIGRFRPLLGSAYAPRLFFEVRSAVQDHYAESGYPEAQVQIDIAMVPAPSPAARIDVILSLAVVPGPLVHVRNIIVRGDDETMEDFVRGRVLLEPGDRYDAGLIRRSFRRLFATGLFRSVDIRLAPEEDVPGERDLIVEVVEGPTLEYFFELGFGSYELARAKAGVRERSLFGRGITSRAEVLGSIRGGQLTIGFSDPWFLQSDWLADLPITLLHREEPAFTLQEAGVNFRLSRMVLEQLEAGLAYRFSLSRVRDVFQPELNAERSLRVGAVGPFMTYDTRDDLFAPSRGTRTRVFAEAGTPYLGGQIHFVHTGITASYYLELLEGTVLSGVLESTWIVPFGPTTVIPIQERLFGGGENHVRSFRHGLLGPKDITGRPLGGEARNLVSIELRQRLIDELWGAVFGDLGNVAVSAGEPFVDFRPAVGAGLRYQLPVGPLRLDAAYNPDRRVGENLFVVHFALGLPY
jgi:outer membrane protein insertion porin family